MDESKEIIKRLKDAITTSGYSYIELEKKTGIAKSSIQRYVSEKTKKVPVEAIVSLSLAVNVSPAYIMGWDQNSETNKHTINRNINDEKILMLSEQEKKLITAYRKHPDMQKSVNLLLGIEPEEKLYIIEKAARNGDNSPLIVTGSKLEELENLPEVPLEDG